MDSNNNFYNYSSSVTEDFEKAKSLAETINHDQQMREDKRQENSIIFGIISFLTGITWVLFVIVLLLIKLIEAVFGVTDVGDDTGVLLVLLLLMLPAGGISFVTSLIAIFNKVNIVSSIGFYSSTHIAIFVTAYILCIIIRGNILAFILILIMLLLLVFLFLRWLKRKQEC